MPRRGTNRLAGLMIAAVVCTRGAGGAAVAGTIPPHPIPQSERWATITHPGNEPFRYESAFGPREVGRVDYEYQIMRTEVTYAEWHEFVQAYGQFIVPYAANDIVFTGPAIVLTGGSYYMNPEVANQAVPVGWRYAARYCNWLHNGKALTAEAFERGVYDTSTFHTNPDGTITDQAERSPGAMYWIPTRDEWTKAAFFDPHRNGPDQPGYWQYPTSSDTAPIPGPPDGGGETSGGGRYVNPHFSFPDVAAYRDVQSPWGLWDASGGWAEWNENLDTQPIFHPLPTGRLTRGSGWYDPLYLMEGLDRTYAQGWGGPTLVVEFALPVRSPARRAPVCSPARSHGSFVEGECAVKKQHLHVPSVCVALPMILASERVAWCQCPNPPCGLAITPSSGWTATEVAPEGSNIWLIEITSHGNYSIQWAPTENPDRP